MSEKADNIPIKRDQADKSASVFGRRMKIALAECGRDLAWLSRETGISTSTLSDYGRGKLPRADKAYEISAKLNVTVEWLLDEVVESMAPMRESRLGWRAQPHERDDLVEVAEIDTRFGLGLAIMDEAATPEMRSFSRAWLRHFTDSPPEDLYWAKGRGNSMAPTIEDGEVVLIDRRQQTPRDSDLIWAFAWGDVGAIKRLRPMPDGSVKILSDNAAVPSDIAVDGELHIFGRVVAVVKRI